MKCEPEFKCDFKLKTNTINQQSSLNSTIKSGIELKNISFKYPETKQNILRNLLELKSTISIILILRKKEK